MRLTKTVANLDKRPELITMLKGVIQTAKNLGLQFKKPIIENSIFYIGGAGSFGQCQTGATCIYIGLNETYTDNCLKAGRTDLILNTLVHEVCHAIKGAINHGPAWKQYARIMGEHYGLKIERCGSDEESEYLPHIDRKTSAYKYMIICPTCGETWKYKTRCRVVRVAGRCYCPICGRHSLDVKEL